MGLCQGPAYVADREIIIAEGIMVCEYLVEHVRIKDFHAREICHVVYTLFSHCLLPP